MPELLHSDFYRLRKNKIFLICLITVILYYIGFSVRCFVFNTGNFIVYPYEFFSLNIGALMIFSSIFSSENFSSGIIRNKISCGYTKVQIYFSNLIINLSVAVLFAIPLLFMELGGAIQGYSEFFTGVIFNFVSVIFLCFVVSLCCFFSFVSSKAVFALILTVIVLLLMNGVYEYSHKILLIPEKEAYIIGENGEDYGDRVINPGDNVKIEFRANPAYPSEKKRKSMIFLEEYNPVSDIYNLQEFEISSEKNYHMINVYDKKDGRERGFVLKNNEDIIRVVDLKAMLIFIFAVNAMGFLIFRKKDIK